MRIIIKMERKWEDSLPSLLFLLQKENTMLHTACGGMGRCKWCEVQLLSGVVEVSGRVLMGRGQKILACQTKVLSDCEISISKRGLYKKEALVEVQQNIKEGYGLAIDIGTTNIKMAKVSLAEGKILATYQNKNSQGIYGADVMARIHFACMGNLEKLGKLVQQDIQKGMQLLQAEQPNQIAVVGNTTMIALLLGDSLEGMKEFPFTPKRLEMPIINQTMFAPAAGPFIGGDVIAGLYVLKTTKLYAPFAVWKKEISNNWEVKNFLFIDLGTNGELVLCVDGKKIAVSVAAGPAFEALDIASGSKALEALLHAYQMGAVDETGLLEEPWFELGYAWTDPETEETFLLTQEKIRELQLAKAAVRTGVEYLLRIYSDRMDKGDSMEIPAFVLENSFFVFLAGGLGVISEQACIELGMLPEYFLGKCHFLGNTALAGAMALLLDKTAYVSMQQLANQIEEHVLATWDDFNSQFIEYINFPKKKGGVGK